MVKKNSKDPFAELENEINSKKENAKQTYNSLFENNSNRVMIDIDKIVPNPKNHEEVGDIERFAYDEILPVGDLIHNIAVRPIDNGKYMLISGERRWKAFTLLFEREKSSRWAKIPSYIMNINNDIDDEITGILANYAQRNYREFDKARQANRLVELYSISGKNIPESITLTAKQLNVSVSQVERYHEFGKTIPAVQDIVKEDKLAVSSAALLARIDEDTQQSITSIINNGIKLTREDVEKIVKLHKKKENKAIDKEKIEVKNETKVVEQPEQKENNNVNKAEPKISPDKINKNINTQFKNLDSLIDNILKNVNELKVMESIVSDTNKKAFSEAKAKLVLFLTELEK